jgi:hypothetical protein
MLPGILRHVIRARTVVAETTLHEPGSAGL